MVVVVQIKTWEKSANTMVFWFRRRQLGLTEYLEDVICVNAEDSSSEYNSIFMSDTFSIFFTWEDSLIDVGLCLLLEL